MKKKINKELKNAVIAISNNDMVMSRIIKKFGKCNLQPHQDYFYALLRAIIGQQLSVKAAASISKKIMNHFDNKPTPEKISVTPTKILRDYGLSNSKTIYVKDLSDKIISKKIRLDQLKKKKNEEIIEELTKVKGIGEWTVHMFLIFTLGRLDVLPSGDLGIKKAIMLNYGLKKLPDETFIKSLAIENKWHPYESVVALYLWESL